MLRWREGCVISDYNSSETSGWQMRKPLFSFLPSQLWVPLQRLTGDFNLLHCTLGRENGLHSPDLQRQPCGGRPLWQGRRMFMSVLSKEDKSSMCYIDWGHTGLYCIFTLPRTARHSQTVKNSNQPGVCLWHLKYLHLNASQRLQQKPISCCAN